MRRAPHVWLIALAYTLAHGAIVLNRGLFWDDWAFWQQDKAVVATAFENLGSTWPPTLLYAMYYSDAGIFFGRFLTFASLLVAAIVLYVALTYLPKISAPTAFWVAVVFAVFPVYQARIALAVVIYSVCVALFALAILALIRAIQLGNVWLRVLAVVLFVLSFRTASLLVLFAVVPLVILLVDPNRGRGWRGAATSLLRHADVLATPVIFWAVSRTFFKPGGVTYVEYNQFTDKPFALVADWFWQGMYRSSVLALERAATTPSLTFVVGGLVLGAAFVAIAMRRTRIERSGASWWIVATGAGALALAVFPYVVVEKVPDTVGWASRHQLLVPFGASLVVVGLVEALAGNGRRSRQILAAVALAAVIGLSIGSHLFSYVGWQRDWFKQQALMQELAQSPEMRSATTFIVYDEARRLDYDKYTKRRIYEYTGMAQELFGDQTRFMMAAEEYAAADHLKLRRIYNPYYKLAEYDERRPQYLVRVRSGSPDLRRTTEVLRLMALDWVDRDAMRTRVRGAVSAEFEPLEWPLRSPE